MYLLEFKGGNPQFSEIWSSAVEPKEIEGPVVLVNGSKCVSCDLKLADFNGEPDSVDQVLIAAWIGPKLTLKNAKGFYIEFNNCEWVARSRAVSDRGLFDVEDEFTFHCGSTLQVEGLSKFKVLVQLAKVEVEPLKITDLEEKAGRRLTQSEEVHLYRAADRGELHQELAKIREINGKRV